jgi:hypothetical protein
MDPAIPPTQDVVYHAWYSDKQRDNRLNRRVYHHDMGTYDNIPGSIYWLDCHGNPVEVTMVSQTDDHGCNVEFIDDLQYRGIVLKYSGVCVR